jgi:hypothetical protein
MGVQSGFPLKRKAFTHCHSFKWLAKKRSVCYRHRQLLCWKFKKTEYEQSKLWEGLHYATSRKIQFQNRRLQISLSRDQSYRLPYLFWQKLVFPLKIRDHFFLKIKSENGDSRNCDGLVCFCPAMMYSLLVVNFFSKNIINRESDCNSYSRAFKDLLFSPFTHLDSTFKPLRNVTFECRLFLKIVVTHGTTGNKFSSLWYYIQQSFKHLLCKRLSSCWALAGLRLSLDWV